MSELVRRKLLSSNTLRKERGTVHTMNVKVLAMTASATPACAARADRAPSMRAPLASLPDSAGVLAEADGAELEEEMALCDTAATGALVGPGLDTTAGVTEEAEPDAGTLEVLFEPVVLPPGRYDGAGTALDGSVRAAVPQGIAWPPG
jgi:hypothetical protein